MKVPYCDRLSALSLIFLSVSLLGGCSESSSSPTTSEEQTQQDAGDSTGGSSDTSGSGSSAGGSSGSGDSGSSTGGNSGSGDSGNGDSNGGNDSGGTVDPATCQSTTHLGQPFQTAQGSDSDPIFHSALAADGCLDASSVWSGNSGDVLVLDTGTPQPMQGIYVWPRYNQLNWLEVSTSTDGSNWTTEWQAIPTRPEQGPQYLSFKESRSLRWVRLKGLKGETNDWVNISEVRWSLTGEEVTVPKALRHEGNSDLSVDTSGRFDLSAWSIHPRLGIAELLAESGMGYHNCGFRHKDFVNQSPAYIWVDLEGLQDTVFARTDLPGNMIAFSYNLGLLDWPADFDLSLDFVGSTQQARPKDGSHGLAAIEIRKQFGDWMSGRELTTDQNDFLSFTCYSGGASDSQLFNATIWYDLLSDPASVVVDYFH